MFKSSSLHPRLLWLIGLCWLLISALAPLAANAAASISITKMATVSTAQIGDEIDYYITIKNTGTVKLTDIAVTDPMLGGVLCGFPTCLDPCESATAEFDYCIDESSPIVKKVLCNTATVRAFCGSKMVTATGKATVNIPDCTAPAVQIIKDVDPCLAKAGDIVNYAITIRNIGNKPLKNIVVKDTNINCGLQLKEFPKTLDEGCEFTYCYRYIVKSSDCDPLINTATVTATAGSGVTYKTVNAWAKELVDIVHPAMEVIKVVDPECVVVGDLVFYTIIVRNTGDVPLEIVSLCDSIFGELLYEPTNFIPEDGCLPPGKSLGPIVIPFCVDEEAIYCYQTNGNSIEGEITNTVVARAFPKGLCNLISASATATLKFRIPLPEITVTKCVDKSCAAVGDTVNFTIKIKNTGDFDLTKVKVIDELLGGNITDCFFPLNLPHKLCVGEEISVTFPYTIKSTDVSPLVNEVTAEACVPELELTVCDTDCAQVTISTPSNGGGTTTPQGVDTIIYDTNYQNGVGRGVYSTDGTKETKTQYTVIGSKIYFPLRVENCTGSPATILITGTAGNSKWKVDYYNARNGGALITSKVCGSGWNITDGTGACAAGGARDFVVVVTPLSGCVKGESFNLFIKASIQGTTKSDTVKAVTIVN